MPKTQAPELKISLKPEKILYVQNTDLETTKESLVIGFGLTVMLIAEESEVWEAQRLDVG